MCGHEWYAGDTGGATAPLYLAPDVGACKACGSTAVLLDRCFKCPVIELELQRARSAAGKLLERTLELDFDTTRFKVGWDEVTAEENQALKILDQERRKWEREMADRAREEAEQERRSREAESRGFRR